MEAEAKDASYSLDTACVWKEDERKVTLATGSKASYVAIVAADEKTLSQGTWTHAEKDYDTGKVTVTRTGVWSARLTGP